MKKLTLILLLAAGCSQEQPAPPKPKEILFNGHWQIKQKGDIYRLVDTQCDWVCSDNFHSCAEAKKWAIRLDTPGPHAKNRQDTLNWTNSKCQ